MSNDAEIEYSVIIVTFNNQDEIGPCLESLLIELGNSRFQIIVIDNHSGDSTRSISRGVWQEKCPQVGEFELHANDTNEGFTKALNQGLKKSKGKCVLALNPDTEVQPGSVGHLRKVLEQEKNVGIVAPQLRNPDGSVQASCRRFPGYRDVLFETLGLSYLFGKSRFFNHWKMGEFDHQNRRSVDQPQGACLMFKRQLLDRLGYWDETFPMFFSDVDWCRRVKAAGYDIIFEPAARVIHRRGASIVKDRSRMIWSSHRSFYDYFLKYKKGIAFLVPNMLLGIMLFKTAVLRIILNQVVVLGKK